MDNEFGNKEYTELGLDEYQRFIDEFNGNGIITPDHKIINLKTFTENHSLFKKYIYNDAQSHVAFLAKLSEIYKTDKSEEFNSFCNNVTYKVLEDFDTLLYIKGFVRVISYPGLYITLFGNEEAIDELEDFIADIKEYSNSECHCFWL